MSASLNKLIKLEKEAVEFGFEWPNHDSIINQALSECKEISDAIKNNESEDRIQEEIGDLLHTAVSLCRFRGFDLEQTINKLVNKFDARMRSLKDLTTAQNLHSLEGQTIEFKLELWEKAKKLNK